MAPGGGRLAAALCPSDSGARDCTSHMGLPGSARAVPGNPGALRRARRGGAPVGRGGRAALPRALAATLLAAVAGVAALLLQGPAACFSHGRPPAAAWRALRRGARAGRVAAGAAGAAGGEGQDGEWREAFELELERNRVLREQVDSLGLKSVLLEEDPPSLEEPEACEVDWSQSYEQLSACNDALAKQIASSQQQAQAEMEPKVEDQRDVAAKKEVLFKVPLPGQDVAESIELLPFLGRYGVFYSIRASLPLGLKLTKVDSGDLLAAFLVEEVIDGGSAAEGGEVAEGDILHALTVVPDRSDIGMKTEDFVSSVVGGFGRFRQSLADASFINTADELVDAMRTNTILGTDTELTLIFERDSRASQKMPTEPLQPEV